MPKPRRDGEVAPTAGSKLVVLVGDGPEWQGELRELLAHEGFPTERVARLDAVLGLLAERAVHALFLAALPLTASDLLVVRRIRELSPGTAVVATTRRPTDPDLKRAFESGATAFLSWPASVPALRHAISGGGIPSPLTAPSKRFPDIGGGTLK
jgi:CheY-like chemotaxis protein